MAYNAEELVVDVDDHKERNEVDKHEHENVVADDSGSSSVPFDTTRCTDTFESIITPAYNG